MLAPEFLQLVKLVTFNGTISYNSNGYAVLPAYTVSNVYASMQPLSTSQLKFLPQGTHFADYINIITNYPITVDNQPNLLGNMFIYKSNLYKIYQYQDFTQFTAQDTNHIQVIACRDNRMTYNGSILNIPFPEVDSQYGALFNLISMVNQCFTSPTLTTIWGFQQELQPPFPYCVVTLEQMENVDNTNYVNIDIGTETLTTNINKQLIVRFSFLAQDQIQAITLMEQFKLNYVNYTFTNPLFQWAGFDSQYDMVHKELYEDRTAFVADCRMKFNWIIQQTETSTQTIDTVAFTLSIPPVS